MSDTESYGSGRALPAPMTLAELRAILRYNPESGGFTWMVDRGRRAKAGAIAGTVSPRGYVIIKINWRLYKAHRLAWFFISGEWPAADMEIDHINRVKGDNRLCNLRLVSKSVNLRNVARRASAVAQEKPPGPRRFGRGVVRPAPMPIDDLRRVLAYDRLTGVLVWAKDCGGKDGKRIKAGTRAGGYNAFGYTVIRINKVLYQASRLAWFIETGEWPDGEIDHRNNIQDDNRFENLRIATRSQNNANRQSSIANPTGYRGVMKLRTGWVGRIKIGDKLVSLPFRATAEEAYADYCAAVREHHGAFARIV